MCCSFCSVDDMDRFREDYTHEELQRGDRMVYHPVTGEKLSDLHYDPATQTFYSPIPGGAWALEPYPYYRPAIGTGRGYTKGQPYPRHWCFDPVKHYLLWLPC